MSSRLGSAQLGALQLGSVSDAVGFTVVGALAVLFTATVIDNEFEIDGATSLAFTANDAVETIFEVDGATALSFSGTNGVYEFHYVGETRIVFSGGTPASFEIDGALTLVFYLSAGQRPECITGSGDVPPGLAVAGGIKNATH